ncbi:hypothetical protein L593_10000 [Salinarchaeum sp. Harcht-Bsk1]|uniref:Nmad3 family putative nucleotide modification protein n=1 Tax=Salinarchaeum sp. Harcht-Bsk1 TaxID=1333523 RepID=UPI0003422934|nr:hypothetical protein [Salinarchaeum sp. Harcht-Bsk1]AGN01945.1 hypothetical protein L593_10000 [Salinarchaeum sp. Harcht-Bsk1]
MPRAVAINVGANSSLPGFRGPVNPDGSAVYVPIPEREPIAADATVPTYADLGLPVEIPDAHRDTDLHLDPSFAEYPHCSDYTYGDEHGVKAAPLLDLDAGDLVLFYATLRTVEHGAGEAEPPGSMPGVIAPPTPSSATESNGAGPRCADPADWRPPKWGAFVIGAFGLDRDPVSGEAFDELPAADRERLAENAHRKRAEPDGAVYLLGDPERSGLLDPVIPLSKPSGGAEANDVVTALSADSGKGPWWRRPLRFDAGATASLAPTIDASI